MTVNHRAGLPLHWRNAIRMRRHTLGWSQDRLAAEIGGGMTQVNVGLIERGERDPLTSTTIRILAALGLALDVVDSGELAA